MITRRNVLKAAGVMTIWPLKGCRRHIALFEGIPVNDIHSKLNETFVESIKTPDSLENLQAILGNAVNNNKPVSIAGGRHAMGGQQFGTDNVLIDMSSMQKVLSFDRTNGIVEVESGIQWPELVGYLQEAQNDQPGDWGIVQKQTGTDRLSVGGALSANAHSRGLHYKPIIQDVESFVLIDADGNAKTCSRQENPELFSLAIGGYGLFGIIASVKLRLKPRKKIERVVELIEVDDLMTSFEKRIADGFMFGDFQYSTDLDSTDLMRKGVFSCYKPVDDSRKMPDQQSKLSEDNWNTLLKLAHVDRKRAFDMYSSYYLSTNGQLYWSDTHQLSAYIDDYHSILDTEIGKGVKGSEMITEIYVPRDKLTDFMNDVRADFIQNNVNLIYGTIRLIEKDDESFLPWANESWVCIIFNLHVDHTALGMAKAAEDFRRLIDHGISYGGNYFLTYHRWAARRQVETCYPQFVDFLKLKKKYDPKERFQSTWYRHYKKMFEDAL